jgi:CHAD domain-containing protein
MVEALCTETAISDRDPVLARLATRVYDRAIDAWPITDVEAVHDVRVAARRSRVALAIAKPCLKNARKRARQSRRLARDLKQQRASDVLSHHLKEVAKQEGVSEEHIEPLLQMIQQIRQASVRKFHTRHEKKKLIKRRLKCLRAMDEASACDPTLSSRALKLIQRECHKVTKLLPHLEAPEAQSRHHRLRLACKHLRYMLELSEDAFRPGDANTALRQMIGDLKVVQSALGELVDTRDLKAFLRHRKVERTLASETRNRLFRAIASRETELYEFARNESLRRLPEVIDAARAANL